MIARLFALKLFAAILLTSCTSPANPRDLPNDCAIVAAEAYSRLKESANWSRILAIHGLAFPENGCMKPVHHVMTAFQYTEESNIMLFDINGSFEIPTTSHKLSDIIAAVTIASEGHLVITAAHFLSP